MWFGITESELHINSESGTNALNFLVYRFVFLNHLPHYENTPIQIH